MKVSIMQPYFVPYIGYFQMIHASDVFVVYDNIEYTKKGWINRNRILNQNEPLLISLPLAKGSDFEHVVQRQLADTFHAKDKIKLFGRIKELYRKAPYYNETQVLIEQLIDCEETNLFSYIHHSIVAICQHLGIQTEIKISSTLPIDHTLRGQDKVVSICKSLSATQYINAIGGVELYSFAHFKDHNMALTFIQSTAKPYDQRISTFVPWLSIIDVLMFCGQQVTKNKLDEYQLLDQSHFLNDLNA